MMNKTKSQHATELETTFIVCSEHPDEIAYQIAALDSISGFPLRHPKTKINHDIYWDTRENLLHKNYTGEDWAAALVTLDKGARGFVEGNYITCGGMDDKVEIYGTEGNIHIDLTMGSPLAVYSRPGYEYAVEKADYTHGWTKPAVDEFMSLGYVNEMTHFVDCVMNDKQPQKGTTGMDGLKALAATFAIYESAESGRLVHVKDFLQD